MKVAILGAGAYGTALGDVLARKGHVVDYYDVRIARGRLSTVLLGARTMVLCVPSGVASYLLPHLPKDMPLIVATKGFLSDELFQNFEDWMVLSGAGFADDIKKMHKTKLTATDARVAKLFRADYLDFDMTGDKKGVLMCGALKNVYAILAGILGLKRGTKKWEDFVGQCVDETRVMLKLNGAELETVNLACGEADLRLTCGRPSRNYMFGERVREGLETEVKVTVEGVATLNRIRRGAIKIPPMAEYLKRIVMESEKWG